MFIDIAQTDRSWRDLYRLFISFIVPRPIALVSTIDVEGRTNLAPFSFYNMVCAKPPVVIVCPGVRRNGVPKDTWINIEATREFAIATVTAEIGPNMVRAAADLPYGESEFAFSGLTPTPARHIRPPLVHESPVNLECRLRQVVTIGGGPGSTHVVFGDVLGIHVRDELLTTDGVCDPHGLHAVGRLGGDWYANVSAPYQMRTPQAP